MGKLRPSPQPYLICGTSGQNSPYHSPLSGVKSRSPVAAQEPPAVQELPDGAAMATPRSGSSTSSTHSSARSFPCTAKVVQGPMNAGAGTRYPSRGAHACTHVHKHSTACELLLPTWAAATA